MNQKGKQHKIVPQMLFPLLFFLWHGKRKGLCPGKMYHNKVEKGEKEAFLYKVGIVDYKIGLEKQPA